jgi:type VI secretion system protein ImpI
LNHIGILSDGRAARQWKEARNISIVEAHRQSASDATEATGETGPVGGTENSAMGLMLQLVNETTLPDGGPVNYRITGKRGIDIGREAHLDWTLPDPTRYISGRHCEIRYKDGGYWLHDVSRNGTFLNGAAHRMHAPQRLRTGDRFAVGHYIVAVTVEGEEGPSASAPPAPPPDYQRLWSREGEIVPPPIDPKQLKSARLDKPVYSDFLDWAADVPNPVPSPEAPYSVSPAAQPARAFASPPSPDMDWAVGPPSRVPVTPPPPPPIPDPRRPGPAIGPNLGLGVWDERAAVEPPRAGAARAEPAPAPAPVFAPAAPAPAGAPPDALLRQIARAAGLPEDALAQRDPDEAAQQIGAVLRLVTENLMQLLTARLQAKRLARVQSHTMIQAVDNNPLKFAPSPADALALMFGSTSQGYLDAHRAIGQGFADLKAHQVKTYAAMRQAIGRLAADLDPRAIEQATDEGGGIAGLLASRKAKMWDTYTARWNAKIGRESDGAVDAFIRYFAEAYDREGG